MCLLGEKARHDESHKRDHYLTHALAEFFEWVPVCPEVDVGMGTPREAIHLVQLSREVRLVGRQSGADHTEAMRSYARRRVDQLASENLSGCILKKGSPSCRLERLRLHHGHGRVTRSDRGRFDVEYLKGQVYLNPHPKELALRNHV